MEAVVTNGAIRRAKLQSNHHYQQANNIKLFTDPMPFWLPNQQCQSTECIYISLTVNFKCQPLRGTSFDVFENLLIFSLPSIWQHFLSDDCLGYNRGLGLRGVLYTTVICRSHGQFIESRDELRSLMFIIGAEYSDYNIYLRQWRSTAVSLCISRDCTVHPV